MEREKISIILPAYNVEKEIERCLNSIINQTYKNLEIIVVNDGSTDKTLSIIEKFKEKDSRIILIDKKNEGVSVARNIAIQNCTGEYINFVDADDYLEKNAIEELYKIIKNQNVDVVRGNYYRNYNDNEFFIKSDSLDVFQNKKILKGQKELEEIIELFYLEKTPCYVWLLLIKRDVIYEKIYFKQNVCMMEDTIFYLELLYNCKSFYISEKALYHYYLNKNSASKSSNYLERNILDAIKVNKYMKDIIFENDKNFKNEEKLNALCVKMVLMNLFKMTFIDKSKCINLYNQLKMNEEFQKIKEKVDLSNFSIQDKIQVKLLNYNNLTVLLLYFKFRKNLKNIKDFILKRKE